MILRNHGLLTVGRTPGEALLRMINLDKACQIQVDALAGGAELVLPSDELALRTAAQLAGEDTEGDDFVDSFAMDLAWEALLRQAERIGPDFRD
jgi:rhamnose utilization protein RhaD (predicted bifunctional aldolase and dehydrogenase)